MYGAREEEVSKLTIWYFKLLESLINWQERKMIEK